MQQMLKGRTWRYRLILAALLSCSWATLGGAAIDPAYANKAAQVHNQMEQRVSNAERQKAADALKAWREDVAQAKLLYKKKTATTTAGPMRGIANTDFDTVPVGPGELLINGQPKPPDYFTTANWAYSPPLAKFVNTLAGVGPRGANNLDNYISIAVPDKLSYPGSDYYEIDLVQFSQKMHSNLAPTRLRGYVQANLAADGSATCGGKTGFTCPTEYVEPPRYLGATIVAQRNVPVRIKFTNKLGTGTAGDLFLPVDQSVMGAGEGPLTPAGVDCDPELEACANYTQNRATIHLHGGRTPWISDGTPHQWITPASETTPYPQGVSVAHVPDMEIPTPGDGSMTFYYSNQQSARLMFYHDHAFGITRLNVYAGEASGYLVQDDYEQELVTNSVIPADVFPLVIQDKTFVNADEIRKYDPLWNYGSGAQTGVGADGKPIYAPVTGDLWLPHVYMPAQFPENPDLAGVNPFGRWMYGPWFYPPTVITHGPTANPYFDPDCNSPDPFVLADCQTPGQNSLMPATPHPSMGMEAFADTAVVNGTVFPALEVEPRAYRFRILNAANDRGFNLSFYKADTSVTSPAAVALSPYTEVKMADAAPTAGWPELWPTDGRVEGVPDPGTLQANGRWSNWGPSFIQIGTDAGFLPKPAIRNPQPVTWITDPTAFWVGVVRETGLGLMPAERADVIVDFCDYAGQTLILYNDAPAAWPAGVWNYDYYTGAPDRRDSGGYGAGGTFNSVTGVYDNGIGILPGYGPNTRTVMQVKVKEGQCDRFDIDALNAEFLTTNNDSGATLFERAMEPIIVGQDYYNEVYPDSSFPSAAPWRGIRNALTERTLKFVTIDGQQVEIPLQPKGIHDEMGASFDPEYGRMSGNLAIELEPPTTNNANLNLYGFSDIPTEIVANSEGAKINIDSLGQLADGTQIWNVSHNGVDTHPIHFHIFDVQLVSRIGWDGQIALPEPNEYGWKDTIRISPLMDTIVAVRPVAPMLPFGITDSIRPLNPALPIGSGMGFNSVDPATGQIRATGLVTNVLYNFGWEYVWHCHILSHEEMDMMRPIVLNVTTAAIDSLISAGPGATVIGPSGVDVSWIDPTPINYNNYPDYVTGAAGVISPTVGIFGNKQNEIGFRLWRSRGEGTFTLEGTAPANQTILNDADGLLSDNYVVEVFNATGSTFSSSPGTVIVTPDPLSPAALTDITLTTTFTGPIGQSLTSSVEYYLDGTLLTDPLIPITTPPYTFVLTGGLQKGNYNITAKAIDSATGMTTFSAVTPITVTSSVVADFTGLAFGACNSVGLTDASTNAITWSWLINGVTYTTQNVTLTSLPVGRTIGSLAGTYPVKLTVTGAGGEIATVTKDVTISNNLPTATIGELSYTINFNETVALTGSGTDVDTCNTLTYAWDIGSNGTYEYFTQNRTIKYSVVQSMLGAGNHTVTLKVTDSSGEFNTATVPLIIGAPPTADAPATITVPVTTTTGSYTISWAPATIVGATYTLEESTDNFATSTVVASGLTTTSQAITGKTDGLYTYRVQTLALAAIPSPWTTGANGCAVLKTAITDPVSSIVYIPGQILSVTATVTTPTGYTVESVAFYDGATLIGTDSNGAPYTVAYTPVAIGTHNLTATTTYVGGATSTSPLVAIAIAGVTTAPTLTSSSAIYDLGDTINLNVTPAAVVGVVPVPTVAAVAYYEGTTPIGFDDTTPYSLAWVPVTGGAKSVTAVVLYSNGMSATSAVLALSLNTQVVSPGLVSVPTSSVTGNFIVSWVASTTVGETYVLEESDGANVILISGILTNTYNVTGKTNGTYTYRVQAVKAPMAPSTWTTGGNDCVVNLNYALQANGSVATASSTGSGWSLPAVNNGDRNATGGTSGAWIDANKYVFPDTVTITFNGQKTINEVDVFSFKDNFTNLNTITPTETFTKYGLTAFDVQYWNGANWVTVTGGNVTGNNLVWKKVTFPAVTTDRIRVQVNATVDGFSRIVEIEAFTTNVPPTPVVTLTTPPDGTIYPVVPATIDLTAEVTAVVGWTTSSVEFYNGAILLGADNTPPYSFSWTNVPAGSYNLTAKAYESLGTTVDSALVSAIVGGTVNVAMQANGGVATASSTAVGWSLSAVNNGDRNSTGGTSGAWLDANKNVFPDTVTITFNGQKTINEVDVFSFKDNFTNLNAITPAETFTKYGLTAFDVQYWDGVSWVTVDGGSITGNNLVWKKITFPALTTTSIRVQVNATVDGFSRIVEIEAFTP